MVLSDSSVPTGKSYVVTAQRPTSVKGGLVCRVFEPGLVNVVLNKHNWLEIYDVNDQSDGVRLELVNPRDYQFYGTIDLLFSIPAEAVAGIDSIVLFTDAYQLSVITWDKDYATFQTTRFWDLSSCVCRPIDLPPMACVDPKGSWLAFHAFQGVVGVAPLRTRSRYSPYNIRQEGIIVSDMVALKGTSSPAIALLFDENEKRKVRSGEIDHTKQEFAFEETQVDCRAARLIPLPDGALLVLGEDQAEIIGLKGYPKKVIHRFEHRIALLPEGLASGGGAWAFRSQTGPSKVQLLVGDQAGHLYTMEIDQLLESEDDVHHTLNSVRGHQENQSKVPRRTAFRTTSPNFVMQYLGSVSIPECILPLGHGFNFIGSHYGDSLLVHIQLQRRPAILEKRSWPNLAPIHDMCISSHGPDQQVCVVTCSGAFNDGSLRVIRHGVNVRIFTKLELGGVKAVWRLEAPAGDMLALSLKGQTSCLVQEEDGSFVSHSIGDPSDGESIHVATCHYQEKTFVIKVGRKYVGVHLTCPGFPLVSKWSVTELGLNSPMTDNQIVLATSSNYRIILVAGGHLVSLLFQPQTQSIHTTNTSEIGEQISCLGCRWAEDGQGQSVCGVGFWESPFVALYTIPDFRLVVRKELDSVRGSSVASTSVSLTGSCDRAVPRSMVFVTLSGKERLIVGTNDGYLIHFGFDAEGVSLGNQKGVLLGTHPVHLTAFHTTRSKVHVFATGDRPHVMYDANGKLMYSSVTTLDAVLSVTPYTSKCFGEGSGADRLVIATDQQVIFGVIEQIQKLHIDKKSLGEGEYARRIAHQRSTGTFGILTLRSESGVDSGTKTFSKRSYFKVVAEGTFQTLGSYAMQLDECVTSIHNFKDEYYIVGTGLISGNEIESQKGRLLAFNLSKNSLSMACELHVQGAVYAIDGYQEGIVACVNNSVCVFALEHRDGNLGMRLLDTVLGRTQPVRLAVKDDTILVGDMWRSLSVLARQQEKLVEVARERACRWILSVANLSSKEYYAGDMQGNVFSLAHIEMGEGGALSARGEHTPPSALSLLGEYGIRDNINVFRIGSLVRKYDEDCESLTGSPSLVFGTVSGGLGMVIKLPPHVGAVVDGIQAGLRLVLKGLGGFDHTRYRAFRSDRKVRPAHGFVDGDYVEQFLDLSCEQQEAVVAHASEHLFRNSQDVANDSWARKQLDRERAVKVIQELSRMHY